MADRPKVEKGKMPSLLHAAFAEEAVMIPLWALRNMTVSPTGAGKLVINGEKAILQLDLGGLAAAVGSSFPFRVTPGTEPGTIKIALLSMLMADADPTSRISITDLTTAFTLNTANQLAWLAIDISALHDDPPGAISASIGHGANWNTSGKNFFPSPIEFDTDDGTLLGSSGTPPDNRKQLKLFVPIARTAAITTDPYGQAETEGFVVGEGVKCIQLLRSHLRIYDDCYRGAAVKLALPWHAPFPLPA